MEAALIDIRDEASVSQVRTAVRDAASEVALPARKAEFFVAAAS